MLKKLFSVVGFLSFKRKQRDPITEGYSPYADVALNEIYNLLFCDKLTVVRRAVPEPTSLWQTLLAETPDAAELQRVANDQAQESRVRLLACNRLREINAPLAAKQLFGTIVELGMAKGSDTLAVYADGRARYINHAGKMSVYEPAPLAWMPVIYKLLSASQAEVDEIGPWDQQRLAPPDNGHVRMSFLVSDGLYFGQGPVQVMQQDSMAQPIIAAGVELLKIIVAQSEQEEAEPR